MSAKHKKLDAATLEWVAFHLEFIAKLNEGRSTVGLSTWQLEHRERFTAGIRHAAQSITDDAERENCARAVRRRIDP